MEDVLEVYVREPDPKRLLVCMDETCKQILSDKRKPILAEPGKAKRVDYEYKREGVCDIFMFFEPLASKRNTQVTDTRTRKDWAQAMKHLSDDIYPDAEKIIIVMDNLNTHIAISFYETFQPEEALRLSNRFEFHYTPKHGSWLNMAEIELGVLIIQCLTGRIQSKEKLVSEVSAWGTNRNAKVVKVSWQFSAEDARIKLRHLYPKIED